MGWPSDGYLAATIMRVLKIFSWVYFFFFEGLDCLVEEFE